MRNNFLISLKVGVV